MQDDAPRPVFRRQLLKGLGAAAGAFAALPALAQDQPQDQARNVDAAPHGQAEAAARRVPFHGPHQAGITTPRPANGILATFDLVLGSLDDFQRMLQLLTQRAEFLTAGGPVPQRDPKLPPADSGLLGPVVSPDNLTVTVALGDSLFERQPWLSGLKPARLQRMVQFRNDALDPALCHGDLSIQFCANLQDTCLYALRDVLKNLSEFLVLRWMVEGSVPPELPGPDGTTPSARNFLGFRDGSANPDATDAAAMDRIVWTGGKDEPEWAHGGSYQAVRIIRNLVERWDRTPLREQERIFGRMKNNGAPLDAPDSSERHTPDYAADPEGETTPMNAHIRLANPRTPDSQKNLMLRRPFNYSRGAMKNGQLDQGLLFIAWQADLEAGFIAVQEKLNGEPLEEYIKPIGGGYFFALPGVQPGDYLGSSLVNAARRS
ncbi:iron uptake transporter deferrochelatase/peroxidase subunit [Paracoccus aminovorans]|uniref:iron uptake transporter deferrochelatase/peroxidase subunit n=1 Tax=Paracoccus aminovorans TaxID=34004 RepID=UPI002B25878F|nr:iron uptake transporter deferrochelatase/peroxidase subunit [Paracoccus aminovorans]